MRICPASGGRMAVDVCMRETACAADCEACMTVKMPAQALGAEVYIQGFNDARKLAADIAARELGAGVRTDIAIANINALDAIMDGLRAVPGDGKASSD